MIDLLLLNAWTCLELWGALSVTWKPPGLLSLSYMLEGPMECGKLSVARNRPSGPSNRSFWAGRASSLHGACLTTVGQWCTRVCQSLETGSTLSSLRAIFLWRDPSARDKSSTLSKRSQEEMADVIDRVFGA